MRSEATWTAPRPDCPHPEWWHAPDDDSAEHEISVFVGAFVRALQPEVVVETGTAFGYTARRIGLALKQNRHGHLFTIETNPERVAEASARCADLPVTVVHGSSLDWRPTEAVMFAWLDSYPPIRRREFETYRPWFPKGAVVGIHDAGPQHGHRDEWEGIEGVRMLYLPTPRGVLFAEVL